MISILDRYWYLLVGVVMLLAYCVLLIIFFRKYSTNDERTVPIWWHLLLGPVALLKHRANKTGQKKLLTSREHLGWTFIVLLIVLIVTWKLISKSSN